MMTHKTTLAKITRSLLASGKGILAADESFTTIEKRFSKLSIESTEENRRTYRDMLFTTPNIEHYISGVIMFDETIRQKTTDGIPFPTFLASKNILPGIKVDLGTYDMDLMSNGPAEKLTRGLEGLSERLKEYVALGAQFTKWRAVIKIGDKLPTNVNIRRNANDLAQYALKAQEAGLVPIVEPEVLMDADNSLSLCKEISEKVLIAVFEELKNAGVAIEGMILKTNMVVPGKLSTEKASPETIAKATLDVFKKTLPNNLQGQAFLSGGQSELEATANLQAINARGPFPWILTFSYGRALQDSALQTWAGKKENVTEAQKIFIHRARMNSLASQGNYRPEYEQN